MKARELALFQSADCSVIVWTIERMDKPDGFQTLIWFPMNDEVGYRTVCVALNEEQALYNHNHWIKKLAITKRGGYSLSYEDAKKKLWDIS